MTDPITFRSEQLRLYDSHNGTSRLSNDPMQRLYGKCGCQQCAYIRRTVIATLPAPINQQNRKGSNNMAGINICDRCGSMVTGNALGQVQIRTSSDDRESEIIAKEVCPACVQDLVSLVEVEPVERRDVRAFREPWKRPTVEKGASKSAAEALAEMVSSAVDERLALDSKAAKAMPRTYEYPQD